MIETQLFIPYSDIMNLQNQAKAQPPHLKGIEMNMQEDIFAAQPFGKVALQKLAPVAENFRLYEAGWLGDRLEEWTVMRVKGAEFRAAKSGPNKGKLCIPVKGTERTTYVTRDEMRAPITPQPYVNKTSSE